MAKRSSSGVLIQGFCKQSTTKIIKENNFVLTPGTYVGYVEEEDDGVSYKDKIKQLIKSLNQQTEEEEKLSNLINDRLKRIDYE